MGKNKKKKTSNQNTNATKRLKFKNGRFNAYLLAAVTIVGTVLWLAMVN